MQAPSGKMTPDEFLAWEREQEGKHHYLDGEIFDMSGGTQRHNRLVMRMGFLLERELESAPCVAFGPDQKIAVDETKLVYPDASVICPPRETRPGSPDVFTNPKVVVEVLSASTETYDRGKKLKAYLALPSLKHCMLVAQREAHIELYTRQDDGTVRFELFAPGGVIRLTHPELSLSVDAIYAGMFEFPGD